MAFVGRRPGNEMGMHYMLQAILNRLENDGDSPRGIRVKCFGHEGVYSAGRMNNHLG